MGGKLTTVTSGYNTCAIEVLTPNTDADGDNDTNTSANTNTNNPEVSERLANTNFNPITCIVCCSCLFLVKHMLFYVSFVRCLVYIIRTNDVPNLRKQTKPLNRLNMSSNVRLYLHFNNLHFNN